MRRDQQIRVNELLLQREELFLRIHAAETEASRLLGEPYPFTRPLLPSDHRAKRKAGPPKKAAEKKTPADTLRRLEDDEAAYRVTYRQFSQTLVETHFDHAAIATLLASQAAHLQVLGIETIDAAGTVRATLV